MNQLVHSIHNIRILIKNIRQEEEAPRIWLLQTCQCIVGFVCPIHIADSSKLAIRIRLAILRFISPSSANVVIGNHRREDLLATDRLN